MYQGTLRYPELGTEIERLNLPPGIKIANGFEDFPNLESIKYHMRHLTYQFRDALIREVAESPESKVSIINAVSGSVLQHYLYLLGIRDRPDLIAKTQSVYAVQIPGKKKDNGQDSKRHVFSEEVMGKPILIDDIVDTAESSNDIERRVNRPDFGMRVASCKKSTQRLLHPGGNGCAWIHVFDDEWIASWLMNSSLGDTKVSKNNSFLRDARYEIAKVERCNCLVTALRQLLGNKLMYRIIYSLTKIIAYSLMGKSLQN